ncbi:hypothetical protein HDU96_009515 [Phlyctochytrium bullatum]|nr:hypothetical protein HDU96_009515 [Phlyctochytrium bullatum]
MGSQLNRCALAVLSVAFCAAVHALALPLPQDNIQVPQVETNNDGQVSISAGQASLTFGPIVLGVLAIVGGLIIGVAGFRLYKPTIVIAGAILGSIIGYTILVQVEPEKGYPNRELLLLLGSIAAGALCGLGGFFLAIFILGLKSGGLIQSGLGRGLFIAALVIVGMIIAVKLEKPVVIVSTSFGGAYLLILGVDCFARTGFKDAVRAILSKNSTDTSFYEINNKVIGMFVGVVAAGLVFMAVQFRGSAKRPNWAD